MEIQALTHSPDKMRFFRHLYRKHMARVLSMLILCALAVALYFLRLRLSMFPQMITMEFSVFPELLASIAYGPVYGVAICLVKDVVHIAVHPNTFSIDFANFLTDSVFITVAGIVYLNTAFVKRGELPKKPKRFFKSRSIILGSLLGIVFALPIQFLTTNFAVYPYLIRRYGDRGYSRSALFENYNATMTAIRAHVPAQLAHYVPTIKQVWQGVLAVNMPLLLVKLLVVGLVTALVYPLLSPVLHYRFGMGPPPPPMMPPNMPTMPPNMPTNEKAP